MDQSIVYNFEKQVEIHPQKTAIKTEKNEVTYEELNSKDFQIKIRGYRIETAEIETALLKHSGVKDVAVWI